MKYAKPGRAFFSVSTPSVFKEFELPIDDDAMTTADQKKWERLNLLTQRHGTCVDRCSYERG